MGDLAGLGGGDDLAALALHPGSVPDGTYLSVLARIALSVALGLFVGMERERRGKEAGMRTFAFASLFGCLCALLGDSYALLGLAMLGLLIVFLNGQRLLTNQTAELTTSAALLVTGVMGVLCGMGHTFTPAVVGACAAALLSWKERMTSFSLGLTEAEVRSAIVLSVLAFVVYPVLPAQALDPWGLITPRSAWVTVLLIAAVGFGNYVLLKRYGARGAGLSGFLGGLVNSTVVVAELAGRAREAEAESAESPFVTAAYQGIVLATAAMLLRNGVLLALLSPSALLSGAALPLLLMLVASAFLVLKRRDVAAALLGGDGTAGPSIPRAPGGDPAADSSPPLRLASPFSLPSALKFGLLFLALHAAGVLAQRWLGPLGVYAVSLAGGVVSSASAVASAGSLAAQGGLTPAVAGVAAVLASLASVLVNLPLVARVGCQPRLTGRVCRALAIVVAAGFIGTAVQGIVAPMLTRAFAATPATTSVRR